METWLSGRKRLTANEVGCKSSRRFESSRLRHRLVEILSRKMYVAIHQEYSTACAVLAFQKCSIITGMIFLRWDRAYSFFFAPRYYWSRFQLSLFSIILIGISLAAGSYLTVTHVILPWARAAGDTSVSWDFSSPGDYTLSDESLLEVASSSVRLKVREYSADDHTALLMHMNESSGTSVDDASDNENDGTATSATWTTGHMNNAVELDGVSEKIAVSDSASLSFSQENTLEAWTKFSDAFSANSHAGAFQKVIDKGQYQLYYENDTGKIVYELASTAENSWTQVAGGDSSTQDAVNGGWDLNGTLETHKLVLIGSDLYVGLGSGTSDAEVWKWSSNAWTKVGGDGVNDGWAIGSYEGVYSLATDGTDLYAGLGDTADDAEVWKFDVSESSWTKIGGDGINSSWDDSNNFEAVTSLTYGNSTLYAGFGASADDSEIWSFNGTSWTKIAGDAVGSSWDDTANVERVAALLVEGSTLYAGLGSTSGDGDVWSYNGETWTQIGGDGLNSGWAASTYEYASALFYQDGSLYAGLGSGANDGEVWRWNGSAWTQIGGDSLNSGWATGYDQVWALTGDGTNVFAGIGNTGGENEVWQWNGSAWTKLGDYQSGFTFNHTRVQALSYGSGILYAGLTSGSLSAEVWAYADSSWTRIGGSYSNQSWGNGLESVETLTSAHGKLYAGTGLNADGDAMVWEFDGSSWTLVGGQGVKSSWAADSYRTVESMIRYGSDLYVGLGSVANDAEVWSYNGTSWTKVGGGSTNSSWGNNYDAVPSMAVYKDELYVGLGSSANEGEVWKWNGSVWAQVGGDSMNSGWTTGFDEVPSLAIYNGNLVAGLGVTAGEAEVWSWNGSAWSRIGGDGENSSWANGTYEQVLSLGQYQGNLYAGLGTSAGDAEVWSYNGTSWTQVGGDGTNSSWGDGSTYDRVRSLISYNGYLWAGLGSSAGEGEVWRYNGSSWTKIGGDGINSGWGTTIESVEAMAVWKGRLYASNGVSANADPAVYSYGGNKRVESTATSQDTDWHHIAGTYDGTTMRLYIDGVLDASRSDAFVMADTSNQLVIGGAVGTNATGGSNGYFAGLIDEVRISDTARSAEALVTSLYTADAQTVRPSSSVMTSQIKGWTDFNVSETANGGTITYRLSSDGGSTWNYWDGDSWEASASAANANSAEDIDTNISSFPAGSGGVMWQAILDGDGSQRVTITSVQVEADEDATAPKNPDSLTAKSAEDGSSLTSGATYAHANPYFSWSGATDTDGSGVAGYYVYFGTDNTADPVTAGSFQAGSTYTASGLSSGSTYYLRIKARDTAQNTNATTWEAFTYVYNTSPVGPNNVAYISPASGSFGSIADMNFSWPTSGSAAASPYEGGPDILGWQYAINGTDTWLGTMTDEELEIDYIPAGYSQPHYLTEERDGDYIVVGSNTIYFRTVDEDGNVSSSSTYRTGSLNYGGAAPTFAKTCSDASGVTVSPSSSTSNSFALSWSAATADEGQSVQHYYYMINTNPPASHATITSNASAYIDNGTSTSVSTAALSGAVRGSNTVYVVASDDAGNYSSSNCIKGVFTLDSTNPDPPKNLAATDASVKSAELWRASLGWDEPDYKGTGSLTYKIQRSVDGSSWEDVATTTGTSYIDTVSESKQYYWRVGTYDTSSESQASPSYANGVTLTPKGSFTVAADLSSEPAVTGITTKAATISWATSRASDSKVAYGVSSGSYFEEEPSKSTHVTSHEINLTNLTPGTTYYYVAKWTDEDGNTGTSDEKTFTTAPPPTVSSVTESNITINSALITFTVKDATKATLRYGTSTAYGNEASVSTSSSGSSYTISLTGLTDDTQYHYQLVLADSDGAEYVFEDHAFSTLPRPRLSNIRLQEIAGTAQPTVRVTWESNTAVSSIVTYYPAGNASAARDEVDVELLEGEHEALITGLLPNTNYNLIVKGVDAIGNEAQSDLQTFTTATDTRPPRISNLKVEGIIPRNQGQEKTAQLIVSWDTDEPSASQVEFGEGTRSVYSQATQEDQAKTFNHLVLISGLTPSKAYHLRAVSRDEAGNAGLSVDTVTITPKAITSALDLVIGNLAEVFGFLRGK